MNIRQKCSTFGAFTLIELLVVTAVFAVLLALVAPSLKRLHLSALQAKSLSNLQQLGGAQFAFSDDFNFLTPYHRKGADTFHKPVPPLIVDSATSIWPITMMPYLGNQAELFWRPDTDIEAISTNLSFEEKDRFLETKDYAPYIIKCGYWMNAGEQSKAPFAISFLPENKPYIFNMTRVMFPSQCIGLTGGYGWFSRDNVTKLWNGNRNHLWADGKMDILWLDGHVNLQYPEDLLEKNFNVHHK